jgi:phosphatidylglycerol---prolipoprotein diacylglyceryl transferase
MSGIVIDIDPVAFRLGFFELRWYTLAVVLAVTAALLVIFRQAKKKGVPAGEVQSAAIWVLIAGVLGARLFHVLDHWDYYLSHPQMIIGFQGLAIWGAMFGGGLAVVIYAWRRRLPLGRLLDVAVPGLIVAQIIGRFGCIVNGDAYGGVTGLPWGFIYINPGASIPASLFSLPTHPYPVYEMLWNAVTLVAVLRLGRRFKRDGQLFFGYLIFYSVGRILLTFVRQETILFWGLQEAQVVALLVLVGSIIAMLAIYARPRLTRQAIPEQPEITPFSPTL